MSDDEVKKHAEARLGRILKGKYRLDRVLGIGGMATVYAATHRNKKKFAIKMLHTELSIRENIRTRFIREGYVANSVDHPGAVAVLDDDVAEDGSAFIVMELLDGVPLDELAAQHSRRVPVGLVVSIGYALLDVLVAAHSKGIVHRDIKPANVFLTTDGRLEVLDFGIARLHDETSTGSTQTGAMLGTPAYMAPEQALAESTKIDGQTDLWAVGATLFVLLTGELVHQGENASQLLVNAATKKARRLASVAPEVPGEIAEVIDRALTFEKADRWPSAQAMRDALAKACMTATGQPPAPLPKSSRARAADATMPSEKDVLPGSSGVGFDATVDASSQGSAPNAASPLAASVPQTTGAAVSKTRRSEGPPPRLPWKRIGVGALACGAVAAGAAAYRAAHAPHVRYCLDIADTNQGPRCVSEIGADVIGKRRWVTMRFTERAGQTVLVEGINFAGLPDDFDDGVARIEVRRDDTGAVTDVIKTGRFGVMREWQKWSDGGKRIDYVDLDGKTPRIVFDANDDENPQYTTRRVEYDPQGRPTHVVFLGPTGHPRMDGDGRYGAKLEYGKTPFLPIKVTNLGADGAPAPIPTGVVFERRLDNGMPPGWAERSFFDANDRPILARGAHTLRVLHDAYDWTGNSAFGLHDEPVATTDNGIHGLRITWDPAKRTQEWTFVDEEGHPRWIRQGWFLTRRDTFDERAQPILREYLDGQGNRVVTKWDASATRYGYDEKGHENLVENLDPSGALTQDFWAYARREAKFDAHGNRLEHRHYNEAGHLAPWKDGGAIERYTFDERDLSLSQASFDADDHPIANLHGYSSLRLKWDRRRNIAEQAYFGPDGKPVVSDDGFAIWRWAYDDDNDCVEISYFDTSGAPIPRAQGYAIHRVKYDERGLEVESDYFDVHGDPTFVKDGYATGKVTRDRNGDAIDESFFGKRGEPILREGGYARKKTTYDVMRRPVEVALFDASGKPAPGAGGWAIERTTYDERGVVVRLDHFDPSNKPVLDHDGRASIVKVTDTRGNLREETSLDTAGKPVVAKGGFATKKTAYDDRDQVIEEALFGADGAPVSGKDGWSVRRVRYDDYGNTTEEAFFDGSHEPVVPKELPYSSMRQRYDERHRLVETSYFDARGVPSKGPDGAAIVRYKRDPYGHALETAYFEGSGSPVASKDGRVVVRSTYDAAGRLVDERFVDAAGAPHAGADGCAGRHTTYDAVGRKTEESCLDAKDSPTLSTDGWALRRTFHDARGNGVEIATYAADRTLKADKDGVARRRNRFTDRNLIQETTFFDAADRPCNDKRGVHAARFTYDDAGKQTGESDFDLGEKAVVTKKGAAAGG
ncbi:MAG: protein kinase domain-containing protein [Polyangiaceae bacterium]